MASVQEDPRIALIHSDYRSAEPNTLRTISEETGWAVHKWNVKDLRKLMPLLDHYDILVFSVCWNFTPGFELHPDGKYPTSLDTEKLKAFVERGGGIVQVGAADGRAGDAWHRELDDDAWWKVGACDHENGTDWTAEESAIRIPAHNPTWCHINERSSNWIELARCAHGKPISMWRRIGRGFLMITVSGGQGPISPEGMRAEWNWIRSQTRIGNGPKLKDIQWPEAIPNKDIEVRAETTEPCSLQLTLHSMAMEDAHEITLQTDGSAVLPVFFECEGRHLLDLDLTDANGALSARYRYDLYTPKAIEALGELTLMTENLAERLPEHARAQAKGVMEWAIKQAFLIIQEPPSTHDRQQIYGAALKKIDEFNLLWTRLKTLNRLGVEDEAFVLASVPSSTKIDRFQPDGLRRCDRLRLAGAGNEYACGQVAVLPNIGRIGKVELRVTNLVNSRGEMISGIAQPIQYLRYRNDQYFPDVVRNANDVLLMDDAVAQPVWVTCYIPSGARPGVYRGNLKVWGFGDVVWVPIRLRVYGFDVPKQQHVPTDFPLRPGQLYAFFENRKWDEHDWPDYTTYGRYLAWAHFLTRYRITPQPYNESGNQERTIGALASQAWLEGEWDGESLTIDWGPFDRHVENLFAAGAAMVRVGYTGRPAPDNERWRFWLAYLPQLEQHVHEKGWDGRVYVYQQDEVRKEFWHNFAIRSADIKRLAPSVKRLTVLQSPLPEQLNPSTDIWVPSMGVFSSNRARAEQLEESSDDTVWVYVCTSSSPPFSEMFMYEPGLNHRLLPWIIWKYQIDGLLYYATAFWNYQAPDASIDDVAPDGTILPGWSQHEDGYSGNGILIYPGGKSIDDGPQASFRLELLRQGLQDYEYHWLLADIVRKADGRRAELAKRLGAKQLLEVPDDIVAGPASFTKDQRLLDIRKQHIASVIERLLRARNGH